MSASDDRTFRLHACNLPVAGASRAIVCDLQRGEYFHIPMDVYSLLTDYEGRSVAEIKADLSDEAHPAVDAAFALLLEHELGTFLDGDLPPIDLTFERPEVVNNAIIDVNRDSRHDWAAIFAELDGLGCMHVELRFYDVVTLDELDRILAPTRLGRLRSIQLLVPHAGWTEDDFAQLCERHPRVASVAVHGAPARATLRPARRLVVNLFREAITSADACGKVHPGYFSTNLATFSEAQRWNTCLNQKVGIDVAGKIKNCPSCSECFGDAGATPLAGVVKLDAFRRVWSVTKDQVTVCRDCEYRYICTDCRAFTTGGDPLGKPAKCAYDPYTGEWRAC
jgi:SPASM domain peptide maturase of grasp-with-spasm system